jgi:hypothetical protein
MRTSRSLAICEGLLILLVYAIAEGSTEIKSLIDIRTAEALERRPRL